MHLKGIGLSLFMFLLTVVDKRVIARARCQDDTVCSEIIKAKKSRSHPGPASKSYFEPKYWAITSSRSGPWPSSAFMICLAS